MLIKSTVRNQKGLKNSFKAGNIFLIVNKDIC